ncbi:MAG TPA: hypothetical protein ENK38_00540 [Gammaproteobacteria bacterium]|nr:hypothetical protein [Gammaproteobacteria bacterium]
MWARRQNSNSFAVILAFALGLSGCVSVPEISSFPGTQEQQPPSEDEGRLAQLVAYFDIAVHMPAEEVRGEYLMQRKRMTPGVCDEQHLLTAMLLLNPALNVANDEQNPVFLRPCIGKDGGQDLELMHLARILHLQLVEKQKQKATRRKLAGARYRLNLLNEKLKTLNEKLDALKSIERSIRERE